MFGVMGNLMSWRLMGIDTLRFILANTPSVGLTSHLSSFCSARRRVSGDDTHCHLAAGTASHSIPSAEVSHSCISWTVCVPGRTPLEQIDGLGNAKSADPAGWPSVVRAKALVPSHSAARRCKAG